MVGKFDCRLHGKRLPAWGLAAHVFSGLAAKPLKSSGYIQVGLSCGNHLLLRKVKLKIQDACPLLAEDSNDGAPADSHKI